MVTRIGVRVVGPALLQRAFESLLTGVDDLELSPDSPRVLLLVGPGWEDALEGHCTQAGARERVGIGLVHPGTPEALLRASRRQIPVLLSWDDEPAHLYDGIHAAATGQPYCSPRLLPSLMQVLHQATAVGLEKQTRPRPCLALSVRELEVGALAAEGLTNDEIALKLYVSTATVKFHLQQVYRKLGISRRAQLSACMVRLSQGAAGSAVSALTNGTR